MILTTPFQIAVLTRGKEETASFTGIPSLDKTQLAVREKHLGL